MKPSKAKPKQARTIAKQTKQNKANQTKHVVLFNLHAWKRESKNLSVKRDCDTMLVANLIYCDWLMHV